MAGLGSTRTATLLAAAAGLVSGAALIIALTSDWPVERDCIEAQPPTRDDEGAGGSAHGDDALAEPRAEITAGPGNDPFAALPSQDLVPVTARHDGVIDAETAMVFEAELAALGPSCTEEYCKGGCFEFVALALDDTLQDIEVRVSPTDDPSDWFGHTIAPGPSVSAGFCFAFEEHPEKLPVRVETLARVGHGRVAVQGWVEPHSERVHDDPPDVAPPATGTPLPVTETEPPKANRVRFMASDPHVPLVEAWLGELQPPPSGACTRWPAHRHRWVALDEWGQIVGTHRSEGGEAYDVTECYEMRTTTLDGADGVGLLASVGYRPGPRFAAAPSDSERRAFEAFIADLDDVWPAGDAQRREPTFFRGADEVLTAVVGGRVLAVAALVDGTWTLRHIETTYASEAWVEEAYRPLAVFDLEGDGHAEIVFRESEGVSWNDAVLSPGGTVWVRAATSVGGGTI